MKALKDMSAATEVVTHDVAPLTVQTDPGAYSKLGWLVVLIGFGGFILWASLAPLDKGVPLSGTVTVSSNLKAVQHLVGGTVQEILVKDGDVVKAGQVLVRMNDVLSKSQAEVVRVQHFNARAAEARLMAERDGKDSLTFPPALVAAQGEPRVAASMMLQRQLLSSRRGALQSELSAYDENIAGVKAQIRGTEEARDSKKIQLGILKEQLDNLRDLAKEGYVARSRLLDMERTYAQVNGDLSSDIGNIMRAQRQVAEMNLRRVQRMQDYQKEVRTELANVQKEAEALGNRMQAMDFELANVEVKAPVAGTVVGLTTFTSGGVIAPGSKLMDIVPSSDLLVAEGQLPVNLVDKVHPGLEVDLNFSAFNANTTPHIPGVITQVSADRFTDQRTGMPYYLVRAKVTPEGAKIASKLDVRPGMPVELFVKTGERTMMNYLFKPLFDRAKTAMSEE